MRTFFLLGAGASVDSGLKTYRGENGIYNDKNLDELPITVDHLENEMEQMWNFLKPLYTDIPKHKPGRTYELIQEIIHKSDESFVATQNIDGYAKSLTGCDNIVELHGCYELMKCMACNCYLPVNFDNLKHDCYTDNPWFRPDITLYGENLNERKHGSIQLFIKRKRPTHVIVIGSTLQFPYLRNKIINPAKHLGAKVIHVNPERPDSLKEGKELWVTNIEELSDLLK